MNLRWKVATAAAVVVLATIFLVPLISATIAISPDPSLTFLRVPKDAGNQPGWGYESDATGFHWLYTLSQMPCSEASCWTTTAMNLTTYQQMSHDPDVGVEWEDGSCETFVQGSVILVSCPQPRCGLNLSLNASGSSCEPISEATAPVGNGTESAAFLLFHQGAVYFYGKYLWG